MNRIEMAERLMDLLPEQLRTRAVVAGSYAVAPTQADDVDLWILDVPRARFYDIEQEVRKHLFDKRYLVSMHRADGSREYEGGSHFHVVTYLVLDHLPKPVQIMATEKSTLSDLLDQFDMSCHAGGFTLVDPVRTVLHPRYTTQWEQPRVLKAHASPEATLRRLEEFSLRYGHDTNVDDVEMLEDLIEANTADNWMAFGPPRRMAPRPVTPSLASYVYGGRTAWS